MKPTLTDLAGYSVEVEAIRAAMVELAPSRLADTSAWVQTSWIVAQAEGALRRAASARRLSPLLIGELADAVRSARAALRDLESLAAHGLPQSPRAPADRADWRQHARAPEIPRAPGRGR